MDRAQTHLELPESLRAQLLDFRRRVWTIKAVEAAGAAAFGVLTAFLILFTLDRIWDTPGWPRALLFAAAALGLLALPMAAYRWIWRRRKLEQLARLLAKTHPRVGDQLLGIIELVRSDDEQARSRVLCEAAVRQVADDARGRDFRDAVPTPRHRLWAALAGVPAVVTLGLFVVYSDAASNAWARLLAPWRPIPRYTFADVQSLPSRLVVAHGEPFTVAAGLSKSTAWRPGRGEARLSDHGPIVAEINAGSYRFDLPPLIDAASLRLAIGDWVQTVRVEPMLRPELTAVSAEVQLPAYLQRPKPEHRDVRGGSISLVDGSVAAFSAKAGRALSAATVDGKPCTLNGATIAGPPTPVNGSRKLIFTWRDEFGLTGKEPFTLAINGREDEAPGVACEDLPRQRVVLDTEQLTFQVHATDDFGVKRIGLQWQGADDAAVQSPALGERLLAAGGPDREALDVTGTFQAKALGIEPQPLNVRVFVEDYKPGRDRVYSPTYTLYVLNAEQHAIWLTEQLSKWHRQSLEVRDRELQLLATNKQLRDLDPADLDRPANRKRIEDQAAAERANGRRLSGLVGSGEELVQQAMRNPEFGVGHLEKWAEMLQILKDISANRMPSVAELLDQGARTPTQAANMPTSPRPTAGQIRASAAGAGASEPQEAKPPTPPVPSVVDMESSQRAPEKEDGSQPPSPSSPGSPRLTLPTTTLIGKGKPADSSPVQQKMDEAIEKQNELLAEFEKVADELNRVLANLEGSTLVKRLKAASRAQNMVAGKVADFVGDTFGRSLAKVAPKPNEVLDDLVKQEAKGSEAVSYIMDDIQSYFERRRFVRFKAVLDEMKDQDVVGSLRSLGDELKKETGLSVAQCEFWSDTLDRWAEDLVEPAAGGT